MLHSLDVGLVSCIPDTTKLIIDICSNETYFFNDAQINANGIYFDTLRQSNGCDSIVQLYLTIINEISPTANNYTNCEGNGFSVTVGQSLYNEANPVGIDTLLNSNGCDSIVNTSLTFFSSRRRHTRSCLVSWARRCV